MSGRRRQKERSPSPSVSARDEEDDSAEATSEGGPTLEGLAEGQAELHGEVRTLARQVELLVGALQAKADVVTPAAVEAKTDSDDSLSEEDSDDDHYQPTAYDPDNPFPRHARDAPGELVDLRNELTYQEFRRKNALKTDPRRQEYRVSYTAASWLFDGLAGLDAVIARDEMRPTTRDRLNRVFTSLKQGYDYLEDRLALIQLWVELQADPRDHGADLLAYCERKVDGFGDGLRLASHRVQENIDMFHDVLGEKLLKELAGTSARQGGQGRFFRLGQGKKAPRGGGDDDGQAGKPPGGDAGKRDKKAKEKARKERQAARRAAAGSQRPASGGDSGGGNTRGGAAAPSEPPKSTGAGAGGSATAKEDKGPKATAPTGGKPGSSTRGNAAGGKDS